MPAPCPFCSIDPDRVICGTELAVAIRDAYPASEGHTLIIPKRHITGILETTPEEREALFGVLAEVRKQLSEELRPDGFNLGINEGVAAGQTIPHLHIHLIPRKAGDVANPRGGVRHVMPGKGDYGG